MTTLPHSIYLDYNATAPLRPQAAERMAEAMSFPANPSSIHRFGRQARKMVEDARGIIAEALGAWPAEIVFTASGSEANNMALLQPNRPLLVSAVEHSSVRKVREAQIIPVDANGIVKLDVLEQKLQQTPNAIVSVMLANNETGVLQPVGEVAALARKHGALSHCDAVQALGKIPLDFTSLGVDMLSISAHKCGGPVGAAALLIRNGLAIEPLIRGGGQELGRRAGTENVAAIAGFATACELTQDLSHMDRLGAWLQEMEENCTRAGGVVVAQQAARLPNTSAIAMPGVNQEVQLMNFDLAGIAVSAGSACSSGRIEPSHVLAAMELPAEVASGTIRISAGWNTTKEDIARFTGEWQKCWLRLGLNHDRQARFPA